MAVSGKSEDVNAVGRKAAVVNRVAPTIDDLNDEFNKIIQGGTPGHTIEEPDHTIEE